MKKTKQPFKLIYDDAVIRHLAPIERKYHALIQKTIKEQLSYEPETETRNRKSLERPTELWATWELRFGPKNQFRVFYQTDQTLHQVNVLAIGVKKGNTLFIGGEEFEL
jgi:hypothetical protein